MACFNLWRWNSRVFPAIDPIVCRQGDRVRIRCGNLSMTNHPIHLHGHEFEVSGTDGGWIPPTARWPEIPMDVAIGQMRAIEFDATEQGDWAFHCNAASRVNGKRRGKYPRARRAEILEQPRKARRCDSMSNGKRCTGCHENSSNRLAINN